MLIAIPFFLKKEKIGFTIAEETHKKIEKNLLNKLNFEYFFAEKKNIRFRI